MTQHAPTWDESRPIYRQLREKLIAGILDRTYEEGELLPSVRQLADAYLINPLTVARAYRELDELTETRRGVGLLVRNGVRELLLKREQTKFLAEEWPNVRERVESLEIDLKDLLEDRRLR
ncbi:MAG TPA: GntR family transcriptional regulator [Gammaproteobacteria bacterium]|jgi:GntR family transcriptional regulator